MDVIMLEKVENLGNIGDQVRVRPGYARNFLLPKRKAALATPENVAELEAMRAELEKKQAEELAAAQARADQLAGLQIRLVAKAGPEGKLFGSIGTMDIAEACTAAGVTVERSEVRLPEGPIRVLGAYEVELHLHTDVNTMLPVQIIGEDGETGPVAGAAADTADTDELPAQSMDVSEAEAAAQEGSADND